MPTVSELTVVINADDKGLQAGLKSAEQQVSSFGDSIKQGIGAGLGFGLLQQGMELVGSAFSAAKGAIVDLNSSLEQSRIAFTTMLGSGEKADAFLTDLQKFAATTPFEFPDLVNASKRLLAMGTAADQVRPMMTAIGNAVAAVGGGKEEINGITMALGQMQAKGKVSAEEMNQLAERGIPAWDMLAKKLGTDIPTAMQLASKGAVSASTFMEAFQEGTAERFGNMMEAQSRTFAGAMSNITDSLTMATAKAFKPFFDLLSQGALLLADFLQSDTFSSWADGVTSSITDLFAVLRPLVVEGFRQLMDAVRTVQQVLAGDWAPADSIDPFVNALGIMTSAFRDDVLPALRAFASFLRQYVLPAIDTVATFIGQQLGKVLSWFVDNFPLMARTFATVVGAIETFWQQHGATILELIQLTWSSVQTIVSTALDVVLGVIKATMQLITGDWGGAWQTIVDLLGEIVVAIEHLIANDLRGIFLIIDDITGGALTTVTTWCSDITSALASAWSEIETDLEHAWTAGGGIVDSLAGAWSDMQRATDNALNAAGNGIVALAQAGWELVKRGVDAAFGTGTGDTISGLVTTGWTLVTTITQSLLSGDTDSALAAAQAGWELIKQGVDAAFGTGTGDTISGAVSAGWQRIVDGIAELARQGSSLLQAASDVGAAMIGAIRDGINGALDGFWSWLQTSFVDKIPDFVKDLLKIHSPSGVFAEIGQNIVDGLKAGMESRLPSVDELISRVVERLGDAGGDLDDWLKAAIAVTGVGDDWLSGLRWLARHESSGDPHAVNPEAVSNGEHAAGLMQTIPSTFSHYRDKDLPNDIFNPIANAVAAIRYIKSRYGSIDRVIHGWAERGGYAQGGWAGLHGPELAWLGERGPEYVVPNSALRSGAGSAIQTHRIELTIGGQAAAELYVTGRETAIRYGRRAGATA